MGQPLDPTPAQVEQLNRETACRPHQSKPISRRAASTFTSRPTRLQSSRLNARFLTAQFRTGLGGAPGFDFETWEPPAEWNVFIRSVTPFYRRNREMIYAIIDKITLIAIDVPSGK